MRIISEFKKGIIKENIDVVISKINIDPVNLFKMTSDDFTLFDKAGCRRLPVAVESGSKKIQRLLKKPVDVKRILDTNRKLKKTSVVPNYLFMMGFPTETKDDLSESVALAFRLIDENPDAGIFFNIYTPYPGTELFDMATQYGLHFPQCVEDWIGFNYRNLTQNAPWLSEEMREIVKMIDFCSFFIGQRPMIRPTEETSKLATILGKMYAPFARKRVEKFLYGFPIEIKLAKFFRLYGK